MDKPSAETQPQYIHRDLSWLSFNQRVLEEAADAQNPLMERAKFLAIFVNNLDEFFMVRVAGLRRLLDSQYNKKDDFGSYPQDVYAQVRSRVEELLTKTYSIYKDKIKPELEDKTIFLKKFDKLNDEQQKFAKRFFDNTLFPMMTPMAVDPGRPFPVLPSKTLAFALLLERNDQPHFAIIPVPKNVPRLVRLPSEKNETAFILVEDIIRQFLGGFFKGFTIFAHFLFRLVRDSEMSGEEEYSPDLLKAIASEVKKRPKARVVSLETEEGPDKTLLSSLCAGLKFPDADVTTVKGDLDLSFLFELYASVSSPQLFFPSFVPQKMAYENIFDRIKEGDFILHVPYQSFAPTTDLLQAAARDKDVLAIKMTLYRTNEDSAIISALKEAAQRKKQVTVLVEIKARFDEERNIDWSRQLEEAGCHVIYGMAGMKIHSKIIMIVRKEEGKIRRYVHLSTGNYNERTAMVYTDIGYFTANDDFAREISDVFNVITGYSLPSRWQRVVSAPFDLRGYFFELIDREIENQRQHKNGAIFAKMNSLEDIEIINKLYAASQSGVKIRLLVRGICCLVPGVKGLSENIKVKSIVGRFLEHSRIFIFDHGGNSRVFLSSADWMRRNFDRRIELLFEIYKDDIKDGLCQLMESKWKDNVKTRHLTSEGTYVRAKDEKEKLNVQEYLIKFYGG